MELRLPHSLGQQEMARRLLAAAALHELEIVPAADGLSGAITKNAGFLGSVRALYAIESDVLIVRVTERPGFLSESALRRMLEDEFRDLVGR
jgi:hypothetical protein